jgi:uncharacterized membrane protein YecN with MAPEG domain
MTPIPVTLASTAACGLLNIWHSWRIGQYRQRFKVSVGDGGQEPLLRRMRAQANFIENAPFVLLLLGGLELGGASRIGLGLLALIFLLARVSHAIGMDAAELRKWRMLGMMSTTFVNLALIFWAIFCVAELCLRR